MLYDNKRWDKQIDETSRLLYQAADIIDHLGHCKGVLEKEDGTHCLVGAIVAAAGHGDFTLAIKGHDEALRRMYSYLNLVDMNLASWNNMRERTPEQVVSALRGGAAQGANK